MCEWFVVCYLQILLIIPNIKTKCLRSRNKNVIWLKWDMIKVLVILYEYLWKNVRNTIVLSRTVPVYICVSLRKITHLCANIKLLPTFVFLCTYKCNVKPFQRNTTTFLFFYFPPVIAKADLCNWSWNILVKLILSKTWETHLKVLDISIVWFIAKWCTTQTLPEVLWLLLKILNDAKEEPRVRVSW